MFCKKCGTELPENTVFCTKCGANQEEEVEQEQAPEGKGHFSKMKKIAAALIAAIVVLAAVVLIIVNQPKVKVMIGFRNTEQAILKERGGFDQFLGLSQLSKSAKNNAFQHTLSLNYDGNVMGSMGLKLNAVTDYKNKQFKTQIYPIFKDQEITELILYTNKEKSVIGFPDLYDKYLFVNNIDEEEYKAYSKDIWKSIIKNMKVKKAGKKELEIGGKKNTCRGYEITISKEDIKKLINNFSKYYLESYKEMENLPYQKDYSTVKSEIDEFRDLWDDDLVLTVYLDSKWRAVSVESEYSMDISDTTLDTKCTFSLLGKKNPLETMEGEFALKSKGEGITLGFSRNQEVKKTNLTDTIEVTCDPGYGSSVKLGWDGNLDTKNGDWKVDISANGENALTAKGTIENLNKGKSFTIALNSIESDSLYELKHLKGSYCVAPFTGEKITDPSDGQETVKISEMSEEEVNEMMEQIRQKVSSLCLSLIM